MRVEYCGLPFDISGITGVPERLASVTSRDVSSQQPFRLEVLRGSPVCPDPVPEDGQPARVTTCGERLLIHHRRYTAELHPWEGCGHLVHPADDGPDAGLIGTLGIALAARLPETGALPLHASAMDVGGAGAVFYGPSGAGKSTVASLSPWPVLSDEFTVVREAPWRVLPASPFARFQEPFSAREVPLVALISLGKGPRFDLRRPSLVEAFRSLLGSVLVPMTPALWSTATALAGRLVRDVAVFRMEWNPAEPPWQELEARLRSLGGEP